MTRLTRAVRATARRFVLDLPALLVLLGIGTLSAGAAVYHVGLGLAVFGGLCLVIAFVIARVEEPAGA